MNAQTNRTVQHVADALKFQQAAASHAEFLSEALKSRAAGEIIESEGLERIHIDLCAILADARCGTGNAEPEMAEAMETLVFLVEEYRETFDLR